MKPSFINLLAGLGSALLLASCGGGGSDSDDRLSSDARPTAVLQARVDGNAIKSGDSVAVGRSMALDATGSTTPSGTLSYAWKIDRQPGSDTISNAQTSQATLVPSTPGEYAVTLTVSNSSGSASQQFEFVATSTEPVAVITQNVVNVPLGQAQLDGRASKPPSGGDASKLTYSWRLVAIPPGSKLTRIDPAEATQAQPRVTLDEAGEYKFELYVSYEGKTSSLPATLTIEATPAPMAPEVVIKATTVEPFVRGQKITLSAGDSKAGTDGGKLQYRWTMGSTTIAPAMQGANTEEFSFTPANAGYYYVTLAIFDGIQRNDTSLSILVGKPDGVANTPPVAVIQHLYNQNTFEVEPGARTDLYGRASYDIDDASNFGLKFKWTLLEEPAPGAAKLEALDQRYAYFTPRYFDGNGTETYKFQLEVQDSDGAWSAPVTAVYTAIKGANRTPFAAAAVASDINTVRIGSTVTVTGEGSTDADSNRLTYQWTLADRPDGSAATLANADQVRASFVPDVAGPYLVALMVTDSHGSKSISVGTVDVFAKSRNNAPIARPFQASAYDREQPLLIQPAITLADIKGNEGPFVSYVPFLFSANAYDLDGDTLGYLWSLTGKPANYSSNALYSAALDGCPVGGTWGRNNGTESFKTWLDRQLSATQWAECTSGSFGFAPSQAGTYDLNLIVTDGTDNSGPFNFSVQAATRETYPTLLLEQVLEFANETETTLYISDPDVDGTWGAFDARYTSTRQRFFPLESTPATRSGSIGHDWMRDYGGTGRDYIYRRFRLTATGGDYTITNLAAAAQTAGFGARFDGLQDGQVIRKGQSVDFKLIFAVPTSLPDAGEAWAAAGNGISWKFGIKEKPDWTFHYVPAFSSFY